MKRHSSISWPGWKKKHVTKKCLTLTLYWIIFLCIIKDKENIPKPQLMVTLGQNKIIEDPFVSSRFVPVHDPTCNIQRFKKLHIFYQVQLVMSSFQQCKSLNKLLQCIGVNVHDLISGHTHDTRCVNTNLWTLNSSKRYIISLPGLTASFNMLNAY